jgi:hypothetical protein
VTFFKTIFCSISISDYGKRKEEVSFSETKSHSRKRKDPKSLPRKNFIVFVNSSPSPPRARMLKQKITPRLAGSGGVAGGVTSGGTGSGGVKKAVRPPLEYYAGRFRVSVVSSSSILHLDFFLTFF